MGHTEYIIQNLTIGMYTHGIPFSCHFHAFLVPLGRHKSSSSCCHNLISLKMGTHTCRNNLFTQQKYKTDFVDKYPSCQTINNLTIIIALYQKFALPLQLWPDV
jgi:hypothetical protein